MTTDNHGPGHLPDDPRELLAAWALDAVDDRERAIVERAIDADPELAAEASGLLETTAILAGSVAAAPPPTLRDDVLAIIAREAASGSFPAVASTTPEPTITTTTPEPAPAAGAPSSTDSSSASPRPRRNGAGAWHKFALAAAIAGALAVPTTLAVQNEQRAEQAEQQMAAIEEAMRYPGARLVQGEVAGGGSAAAVLMDGEAIFTASDLPDPGEGRAYQLWRGDGEEMVSVGVLEANGGRVTTSVEADIPVEVLAVSIEPAGGSTTPTTEPIVVLAAT